MNKYYTPEVQEFQVGYQFEESWSTEGKEWLKVTIKNAAMLAYWMDTYAFDSKPEEYRTEVWNQSNRDLVFGVWEKLSARNHEYTLEELKKEVS